MLLTRLLFTSAALAQAKPLGEAPAAGAVQPRQYGGGGGGGTGTKKPAVDGTPEVVGNLYDSTINRDSCTSVRLGKRELWTCRDSESMPGAQQGFFWGSSASWTDFNADGTAAAANGQLPCKGTNSGAYFQGGADECDQNSGACTDKTRYAIWPDSPPLSTGAGYGGGTEKLYTWIRNVHMDTSNGLGPNVAPPTCSLYRIDYAGDGGGDDLPPVTLVQEAFWPSDAPAYGNYGGVVVEGTAYLYGLLNSTDGQQGVALAKVGAADIEDTSKYQFYHPATQSWDGTRPQLSDMSQAVENAGTSAQGTFFYSAYFQAYVWIGSPSSFPNAQFVVTTAPKAEGPWDKPTQIYEGQAGTKFAGYSQQAHPGMGGPDGKDIYLSFTRQDDLYTQPVIHLKWQ